MKLQTESFLHKSFWSLLWLANVTLIDLWFYPPNGWIDVFSSKVDKISVTSTSPLTKEMVFNFRNRYITILLLKWSLVSNTSCRDSEMCEKANLYAREAVIAWSLDSDLEFSHVVILEVLNSMRSLLLVRLLRLVIFSPNLLGCFKMWSLLLCGWRTNKRTLVLLLVIGPYHIVRNSYMSESTE